MAVFFARPLGDSISHSRYRARRVLSKSVIKLLLQAAVDEQAIKREYGGGNGKELIMIIANKGWKAGLGNRSRDKNCLVL
jgi:hypothetical protein